MDKKIREKVLKEIKPSMKEDKYMNETVKEVLSELVRSSKKLKISCEFFIGGSFGKNTYLKNSSDIDIFVRFDRGEDSSKLSSYVEEILKNTQIDYKLQKGSRDYFSFERYNRRLNKYLKFELVPNYLISNIKEVKYVVNSTDISPLHVDFLKSKAKHNSKLKDEIRLAKQFFKAKGLYGAETYIQGFSGHIIDILIIYAGSLEKLLKIAKNWKEEEIIDINQLYFNDLEAKKGIEKDKLSKLVVIDPIIKTRNAAKALSQENYNKFLLIAQNFDKFREKDFKIKKFNLVKTLKNTKKHIKKTNLKGIFYIFTIIHDDSSLDIIGSKLLKLNKKLEKKFTSYDFSVFSNNFYIDLKQNKCLFVYLFESDKLVKIKKVKGPKVFMKEAVKSFSQNRDFIIVEGERVYSYEPRNISNLHQISSLNINECENILNKDVEFIKKIKLGKF